MYMGDSVIASKAMTGWNTSGGEFFGVGAHFISQYTPGMAWAGKLDAVAVYNRALSASEISVLADNSTDQLITTRAVRPASANYALIRDEAPSTYYSINGRSFAGAPVAGISVGSGLVKILRLR
jgi:hypothetical protein